MKDIKYKVCQITQKINKIYHQSDTLHFKVENFEIFRENFNSLHFLLFLWI